MALEGSATLARCGDANGTFTIYEDGSCTVFSKGPSGFCHLEKATWVMAGNQIWGKGSIQCDFPANFSSGSSLVKLGGNRSASGVENGGFSTVIQWGAGALPK